MHPSKQRKLSFLNRTGHSRNSFPDDLAKLKFRLCKFINNKTSKYPDWNPRCTHAVRVRTKVPVFGIVTRFIFGYRRPTALPVYMYDYDCIIRFYAARGSTNCYLGRRRLVGIQRAREASGPKGFWRIALQMSTTRKLQWYHPPERGRRRMHLRRRSHRTHTLWHDRCINFVTDAVRLSEGSTRLGFSTKSSTWIQKNSAFDLD